MPARAKKTQKKASVGERTLTKGDETRARIYDAAVRLFAEEGYVGASVERIAAAAGVAKGTFFVHFATKDAIVTTIVRRQVRGARTARERVLARGGSPVDALRATVMALGEQAGTDRNLSRAVVSANVMNPALGGYAESLFGGIVTEMRDDVRAAQRLRLLGTHDPETVANALIGVYLGAVLYFATAPGSKPLVTIMKPILEVTLAGFSR
jgi:AcrR family transcriptional regulator